MCESKTLSLNKCICLLPLLFFVLFFSLLVIVLEFQVSVTYIYQFTVCKSVHHLSIQINQTTRCNNFSSLLLDVYIQFNMFRASSRPSSGATTAVAASGLLSDLGDRSAVGRGRSGRPVCG
jgi:ABC-type sugar transport system permease subunit